MAVLQTSDVMCLCVFLHFTTGCTESSPYISCSPGESVLLHCRDEDPRRRPIQWWRAGFEEPQNSVDVINDQRFKDRVQIHGNLSLSIARLTVDDSGVYWCDLTAHVLLIIEGCSISGTETSVAMRRYSEESVFLSCLVKCSTRFKPDKFRWTLPNHSQINQMTKPTKLSRLYQGRIHMSDVDSGNFSLLISNLTETDEGLYVCWINDNQQKSFSLTIKGCVLSERNITKILHAGESVMLPCSCEDPRTQPQHIEWKLAALNKPLVSDAEDVNGRFQILRDSPHNFSLRISNLTEADGGLYVCTVNGKQSRSINLTVTADVSKSPLIHSLLFLICLTLVTGFICWRFTRARKGRRGSRESQSPDPQDDVTYSSVIWIKGGRRTCGKEEVVYSSVRNGRSAQDDVI